MKRKSAKPLALLLTVLMLLSCVPPNVFAGTSFATVKEYLCAPSQYTNAGYGSGIEKTLSESGSVVSLGDFGGYVIYEFAEKIRNSNTNPYGIDFKIVGNAFNGNLTTQEPGQVWVSQDGNDWYALAGSEHYEDCVVWDYQLTYKNNGTRVLDYTDNCGGSGTTKGAYPLAENYPTVAFSDEDITLEGVLLKAQRTASTANGISTSFGYVDALVGVKDSSVVNPYVADPAKNSKDGQFDISWAVDDNGYPVKLDWVKFVKVQTATFIDGGAYGEKSTEISKVVTLDKKTVKVGKTSVESISVNGTAIELSEGKIIYDVTDLTADGKITVSVASANSDIYINNTYGAEKVFASAPEKGLIRVIAQSGNCEPAIYYLKTAEGEATPTEPTEPDSNLEHIVGEDVTISFSAFDGSVIMPKAEITVSDGLAEEYGYSIAKKDHNGNRIESVTVMDVLVAAHKEYYGDSFTKETAEDYLVMNNSFITRAFGKSAASSGFVVNDITPNDGVYNPSYGSYTGYACDTAQLVADDEVTYFFYQDTESWMDYKAVLADDAFSAKVGEAITLNVSAYCLWYGSYSADVLKKMTVPADGVDIYTAAGKKLATTDKNGRATISFDEVGEHLIYVAGEIKSEKAPLVIEWARVSVKEAEDQEPTEPTDSELSMWQKILEFFKNSYQKVINFFKLVYNKIISIF